MSTPQVLIVEDDLVSARLLAAVLHSEGWESVVAPTFVREELALAVRNAIEHGRLARGVPG